MPSVKKKTNQKFSKQRATKKKVAKKKTIKKKKPKPTKKLSNSNKELEVRSIISVDNKHKLMLERNVVIQGYFPELKEGDYVRIETV